MRARTLLTWTLAALVLGRLALVFDPYGAAANPFNSDMGLLVLMARDGCWSPFALYFYGQDRIGAWPYWLSGSLASAAGFAVDARAIHAASVAALAGSIALVLAAARVPVAAGLVAFAVVELAGDTRLVPYHFDVCHPCAWPLACLLVFVAVHLRLRDDPRPGMRPAAFAIGLASAVLGVWALRSLAVPMLALPVAFHVVERRAGADPARRTRYLAQLLAVLAAIALEQLLRLAQLEHGTAAGWAVYQTPLAFELESLDFDLVWMARNLFGLPGFALLAGSLVVLRSRQNPAPGALAETLLNLALVYAMAVAVSGWPRLNQDSPRYASLPYALFAVAFAAAVAPHLPRPAVVALGLVGLALPVPGGESARTAELRRHARLLEEHHPGAPIIGSHWGTYVYPALQRDRPVVPVLLPGFQQRTPWNFRALARADRVLVSRLAVAPPGPIVRVRGFQLEELRREAIPGAAVPVSLYRVTRRPPPERP